MGEIAYIILLILFSVTVILMSIFNVNIDFDEENMYIWYTYKKERKFKQFNL